MMIRISYGSPPKKSMDLTSPFSSMDKLLAMEEELIS